MFLKTALVRAVSLKDMKDKYGHNLETLWKRFKTKEADPALDRFDATVRDLHEFEQLRYPDTVRHGAMGVAIARVPQEAVTSSGMNAVKQYGVILSDVDRIVMEGCRRWTRRRRRPRPARRA